MPFHIILYYSAFQIITYIEISSFRTNMYVSTTEESKNLNRKQVTIIGFNRETHALHYRNGKDDFEMKNSLLGRTNDTCSQKHGNHVLD